MNINGLVRQVFRLGSRRMVNRGMRQAADQLENRKAMSGQDRKSLDAVKNQSRSQQKNLRMVLRTMRMLSRMLRG